MEHDQLDYQDARRAAQEWVPLCANEIKKQYGREAVVHDGSTIETKDDVVATLEIGGALIQMAVHDQGHKTYRPVLIVTEKVFRQHRVGIGHQHAYMAMQSGRPNFKKAVKNAVIRAKEIDGVAAEDQQHRAKTQNLRTLQDKELKSVRIPPGLIVARCQDGSYIIHIGTAKVNLECLKHICADLLGQHTDKPSKG